jgi:hypothetical protein
LQEIKVQNDRKSLKKSYNLTANTTTLTSKELLKAACCNLAESFETNPSIDVNFSDALTGTKQIKMLGLTSPYLMITEENIPSVRGASQAYSCPLPLELGSKASNYQCWKCCQWVRKYFRTKIILDNKPISNLHFGAPTGEANSFKIKHFRRQEEDGRTCRP